MTLVEEAIHAIEAGETEKGLKKLEQASHTDNHEEKFTIAELYYELGHLKRAQSLMDELLLLYPDEGSLSVFAAEMMIDDEKEDEAIELLLDIKPSDEAFLQAQILLADLYQMQALDEVAEQKLIAASEHAPDEVIITYGLGEFYLDRGDYSKSIPYLKKAVAQRDELKGVPVDLKLAEAFSATGEFEEALQYYQRGIDDSMTPDALFGFGFTAYQAGDTTLAIEQLEALKSLDSDFTSLYPYLAKAYETENRLREAIDVLKGGMTADEFNDQLHLLAGKIYFKQQDAEQGEHHLRQALALNPSNMEALQTLAAYLRHDEQYEELLELSAHARSYGEEDAMLDWYEAFAFRSTDEYEKAYPLYQEALAAFSEDPDFLEEYAHFLMEYGLRDEAASYFRKLIELKPDRMDIIELLEEF
ncbi:tetratricopeptide repeat protein [Alkalicoccobacillus murimartini]|uniref:Tetratricopeptide (TPR) repeat protein n=1 Tax=Alkalicoccobacillus murimartini TaxID=171685 RepID=A0ABT9YDX7_9BACI|nr:tetratricopeptide repeat protein [Alkalicoccobacillus murimartini]MDQ0205931.1 tetratricopeptide (TPR) repeat protein [Alkalicoccobacillus murimartini]